MAGAVISFGFSRLQGAGIGVSLVTPPERFMMVRNLPFQMHPFSLHLLLAFLAMPFIAPAVKADVPLKRILFLGNSITLHGPKADIGWDGNWGMAASAKEKDYAHLVAAEVKARTGTAPETMVRNIADFERGHEGYDLQGRLKEAISFHADVIILAIGENVPELKTAEAQASLQESVTKLLNILKAGGRPRILVRSCFWQNTSKDEALRGACAAVGGTFVDIRRLSTEEGNFARSERAFQHAGVASHPGDKGMAAIAMALLEALELK